MRNIDRQLLEAAEQGDAALVRRLLDEGADVNAGEGGAFTHTALMLAVGATGCVNADIAKMLISAGANVNAKYVPLGSSALNGAASSGDIECVRLLLENGADANLGSERGGFPLVSAISHNMDYIESDIISAIIHLLLENGADTSLSDTFGTALAHAAAGGEEKCLKLLVDAGADVNAPGFKGMTPLLWAAKNGQTGTTRLLIESGADTHAADERGQTALSIALENGYEEIASLLRAAGAHG